MNTKHTPGPWRHEMYPDTNYARIFMFPDSNDSLAGYCGEANARLVATAPELLEACKAVVKFWDSITEEDCVNNIHVQARIAIAKATGETP